MFKRLFGGNKEPQSPEEQARAIQKLVAAGKKIEAIKAYRQLSGLGLAEAKDHIDAMAAELGISSQAPPVATTDYPSAIVTELENQRKINAVKLYRKATGVGLREAKDAVDAAELALKHGRNGAVTSLAQSLNHHGLQPDPKIDIALLLEQLRNGRKIHAIKAYRQMTGQGLKEAKIFIDQLEQQLNE